MKIPVNINILYWLTNIFYWLTVFTIALFVLISLLSFWGIDFNFPVTIAPPIDTQLINLSTMLLNGEETPVKISRAVAVVKLADLNMDFRIMTNIIMLISIGVIVYAASRFRKVMMNVRQNIVFSNDNINILKHAAYSLFVFWFLEDIIFKFYKIWYFNISHFNFDIVEIIFANYFVAGIITLVLASIFERGLDLQNENNLTI